MKKLMIFVCVVWGHADESTAEYWGTMFREGVCACMSTCPLEVVEARELLLRKTHCVSADTAQEWLAHPHLKPLVTVFICPPLCVSFVCCFWFFLCSLCRPDWPWSHSNLSLLPPKWWIKGVCHHQPALCIFFIDPFTVVIYILFSVSLSHRHSLLYHFSQVYCHNW